MTRLRRTLHQLRAGVAQLVERKSATLVVTGSNPVSRSKMSATVVLVAQEAERSLGKGEVAGSTPAWHAKLSGGGIAQWSERSPDKGKAAGSNPALAAKSTPLHHLDAGRCDRLTVAALSRTLRSCLSSTTTFFISEFF